MKFAHAVFYSGIWYLRFGADGGPMTSMVNEERARNWARAVNKSLALDLKAATVKHGRKEKRVVGRRLVSRMAAARKAREVKRVNSPEELSLEGSLVQRSCWDETTRKAMVQYYRGMLSMFKRKPFPKGMGETKR